MKTNLIIFALVIAGFFTGIPQATAQREIREVPVFTDISLRVSASMHVRQGDVQKVEVEASRATLDELITEVKDRALIIRFPTRHLINRSFDPGKITIYVTVPEINALMLSGSGDIMAENTITTRILDLNVSGSGSIILNNLNVDKVKAVISGSGDIVIKDGKTAGEFNGTVSGSGNIRAADYEAQEVSIRILGSGNSYIHSDGNIHVRIAGSGSVYYSGNPNIDSSIAGSGKVVENN